MLLLLASHNPNKKREIEATLPAEFEIKDLNDLGFDHEIEETGKTFEENALLKARYFYNATGLNCIAEDSGLEIIALNKEPGVYSARYAGLHRNDQDNINMVLFKMKGMQERDASFRTLIACILNGSEYLFEGIVEGSIALQPSGTLGFGYDPIFIPKGYTKTFGELGIEVKSKISHRSKAIEKLIAFLKN